MSTVLRLVVLAALMFLPVRASAQITATVAIMPSQAYTLSWDAGEPASSLAEDQITGYVLIAASALQTGAGNASQHLKTWNLGNVLSVNVPGAELPTIPFFLSVRAKSAAGDLSDHSNTLSFRLPGAPTAPRNLRRNPGQ